VHVCQLGVTLTGSSEGPRTCVCVCVCERIPYREVTIAHRGGSGNDVEVGVDSEASEGTAFTLSKSNPFLLEHGARLGHLLLGGLRSTTQSGGVELPGSHRGGQ